MKVFHDSRNTDYRYPFGAVKADTEVSLSVDIEEQTPENVNLILWHGDEPEPEVLPMKDAGSGRYSITVKTPGEGMLLWYVFQIETEDEDERQILYYGNNERYTGGEGSLAYDDGARYQITVYKVATVPEWYKDGIVYQIFPDRFARDDDWEERCQRAADHINTRPGGERRTVEKDWNRRAYYVRDDAGRVTDWPFYGGSFKGIEDKLDYLKSLGVTAIYLNPIFASTSNHHYDTADYMKPDESLGTEEDFARLARSAKECGIRIILDGVFSHTGADSIYFDRYGNYRDNEDKGAYQSEDSPYRSWYRFDDSEACGYRSWWGVDDLPEVEENDPGFRELITGKDGVIEHWTGLGASGWRLDVADELPDDFIRAIRSRVKETREDALLIGEVWEDASNKISYGERRQYFMGDELDGVMNYPMRSLLLDYVNYTVSSGEAGDRLMSLSENYPPENFYGGLNLIGSHDRERIITAMAADEDYPSAVSKVRLLSTLQYTLPGVPCIYYGDEVGLTGRADPENRNAYPWGYENLDLGYHYRMLGLIYNEHPVLRGGAFTMLSGRYGISDDVFAFVRNYDDTKASDGVACSVCSEKILVLANRSYGPSDVDLRDIPELRGGYALELLSSTEIEMQDGVFKDIITMQPLSSLIICIMDEAPVKEHLERGAGVICHISSLGKGVLGAPARDFVDYLASAGMKIWQVLPVNPPGLGASPYSSEAGFAGNKTFINYDELPDEDGYEAFCTSNRKWLQEYTAYTLIKELQEGRPWTEWPEKYRDGDPVELLRGIWADHSETVSRLMHEQYWFDAQWKELKEYAGSKGILLMGDLPIYMAEDSADVWANKSVFRLDEDGRLKVHAGVPPDQFSANGQDWGNPLYDWESLRADGYGWWMRRLRQCAERYDILRLDHFRGFSEYYAIPYGKKPASGVWQHSAGIEFFRAVRKMLDDEGLDMKIVAEDLGFLDSGVRNLLKLSGLPGMDIWQFTSDEMMAMEPEKAEQRAFYTGTHDNDTLTGYVMKVLEEQKKTAEEDQAKDPEKDQEADTADTDSCEELRTEAEMGALEIIRKIYKSPAALAMMQLQDMFLLGSDSRMNVPGIAEGNWGWKIPGDTIIDAFPDADERAAWFKELAEKTDRI